jgi:uncharacterized integral membrane protein
MSLEQPPPPPQVPETGGSQQPPSAVAVAPEERRIAQTRTSATFKSLIAGAVVLVLLLVFILENTRRVKVTYFGASGHLPLGVALLLAAVAGALVVGIVGSARILQLRKRTKRHR